MYVCVDVFIIVGWKHRSINYAGIIKSCWSIIIIVTLPRSDLVAAFMIEQLELGPRLTVYYSLCLLQVQA